MDNADDLSWGLDKVIPKGGRGCVIVTSQDDLSPRLFHRGCERVLLDITEALEAMALLPQHLEWDVDSVPEDVRITYGTIVEQFGYLAPAVDLAGAYIGNDSEQEAALWQFLAGCERQ